VLETGEGMRGGKMRKLQLRLAEQTMTCSYDRANTGSSSPAPTPRTGQDIVEDLYALLAAANVPDPICWWGTRREACSSSFTHANILIR
jgi:hypothetical protein